MTRGEAVKFAEYAHRIAIPQEMKEFYALAEAALEEQEERRWIPVAERLPERFGQYVLITDEQSVSLGYVINRGFGRVSPWYAFSPIYPRDITHWMPLPEPPEGSTHENP